MQWPRISFYSMRSTESGKTFNVMIIKYRTGFRSIKDFVGLFKALSSKPQQPAVETIEDKNNLK